MKITFLVFLCFYTSRAAYIINADDDQEIQQELKGKPDAYDIEKLVKGFGYPFEKHTVTTEDGYILEIHRVPHGQDEYTGTDARPPIIVMHGLLGSSADFFHIGVGKSLPLRLADVGYDVWVGNNRGNTWGRKHQTLDADKNDTFWDYSLHELGFYDAPATVDYILETTKADKISYVGHSVGATQFFIMTSTKPQYNDKINVMAALAPIVYVGHTSSILLRLINSDIYLALLALEKTNNLNELLSHSLALEFILSNVCKDGSKLEEICEAVLFFIQGFDSSELNKTVLAQFLLSFPAGASAKEINHFLQERISGDFKQYDYGKIKNYEIYQNLTPPSYDLSKVTVPVGIFYGQNDLILASQDIDRLATELPNLIENHQIEYPKFNHLDFLLATDVDSLANIYIINTLNDYNDLPQVTTTTSDSTSISNSISTTTDTSTTPSGSTIITPTLIVLVQVIFFIFFNLN